MSSETNKSLRFIYHRWQAEDQELEACIDEVRKWMQEVSQLGIPHFGETATRLRPLQERLLIHFEREDRMIAELSELYPLTSPEVQAVRSQSSRDHTKLESRLEDLVERLGQLEPPFASWQSAIDEVERFVDVLEQHEDQESESFQMLMPSDPGTSGEV